jgi:hypothetical protein
VTIIDHIKIWCICLLACDNPERTLGSPPLNRSSAAETSAELKNTTIKFAPKTRISKGITGISSAPSPEKEDKSNPTIVKIIQTKTITKIDFYSFI